MILHAEKRQRTVPHTFIGVIIQVYVRDFHFARRQRIRIDGKPVVLSGDLHAARAHIFYGMIRTVVAEFELVGAPAERQPAKLVSQSNAEYRYEP